MKNAKVNFKEELIKRGYSEEIIKDHFNKEYCTNYQKETSPQKWNCITIFPNGLIRIAPPLREINEPQTKEEIDEVLKSIGDETIEQTD